MKDRPSTKWPYSPTMYARALAFAREYDARMHEADALIEQAPVMDGQPRGTKTGDPVAAAAIRRENAMDEIRIVDTALTTIPPAYRKGIFENVVHMVPFYALRLRGIVSENTSNTTLSQHRQTFLVWICVLNGWEVWRQF